MAIAFDTSSSSANQSKSWSHTCTGSNLALVVGFFADGQNVTGVTYNSVAMTNVQGLFVGNGSCWLLLNPSTGANTITVTTDVVGDSTFFGAAVSYSGVQQTGQPDSSNKSTLNTNPLTVSTTVVASNCWLVGMETSRNTATPTTNKTDRIEKNNGSNGQVLLSDTNAVVGTGSQGITWTDTAAAGPTGVVIMSLAPFVVATSSFLPRRLLMGIG